MRFTPNFYFLSLTISTLVSRSTCLPTLQVSTTVKANKADSLPILPTKETPVKQALPPLPAEIIANLQTRLTEKFEVATHGPAPNHTGVLTSCEIPKRWVRKRLKGVLDMTVDCRQLHWLLLLLLSLSQSHSAAFSYDDGIYNWSSDLDTLFKPYKGAYTKFVNGANWRPCIYDEESVQDLKASFEQGALIASHTWSHAHMNTLVSLLFSPFAFSASPKRHIFRLIDHSPFPSSSLSDSRPDRPRDWVSWNRTFQDSRGE